MRHLTLDDFVFGMEHLEQPQISESEAEDEWGDSEEKAKEQARNTNETSRAVRVAIKTKTARLTPTDEVNAKDTPQHEQQPKPQKPKSQNARPKPCCKIGQCRSHAVGRGKSRPQPTRHNLCRNANVAVAVRRKKNTGDAPAESAAQ